MVTVTTKGKLFAFEGIDASGKATQSEHLQAFLRSKGRESIVTGEPVYDSPTGKLIKDMLYSKEKFSGFSRQLLYSTDRSFHVDNLIMPTLQKGVDVIADRYFLSTLAYSIASGVNGNQLDVLKKLSGVFPYPEIILILDVDPKESFRRMKFVRRRQQDRKMDEFEKKTGFMEKVRLAYHELSVEYPNVSIIDGNRSVDDVSKDVIKIIGDKL